MATVVRSANGQKILYVKGAPEIVFGMCSNHAGVTKDEINARLLEYQNQAMRTLGFAWQVLAEGDVAIKEGKVAATSLTFLGIVAISDPVRADVPEAVREVVNAGVKVKIVTGDTPRHRQRDRSPDRSVERHNRLGTQHNHRSRIRRTFRFGTQEPCRRP